MLFRSIHNRWPNLDQSRTVHELGRRLITRFVEGVIFEGKRVLEIFSNKRVDDIRSSLTPVISFPEGLLNADREIKAFLFPNMYRQRDVVRIRGQAEQVVCDLFQRYARDLTLLPDEWTKGVENMSEGDVRRMVADYIAGMTDRFALSEHRRLFDVTPELR